MIPSTLSAIPAVPARRLALQVTPDALRQIRGGHPWVYADAITSNSIPDAPPGSLGVVFDGKRNFAAIGLWDPASPIRLRVLHQGSPTQIDPAFFEARIRDAALLRSGLIAQGTSGYRLLHGENDGFGGVIVDRYDETLVMKVYSEAWSPHLPAIVAALEQVLEPLRIVIRFGRLFGEDMRSSLDLTEGQTIVGAPTDGPIEFTENHLRFEADVVQGQKTGHFLDQRDNRRFVRDQSSGSRVLDCFSCTGGFSVHAAAGGASSVHSVDLSRHAIASARRNMALNEGRTGEADHRATVGDAFEVLAELGAAGESYDLIIVDPPSFASRASERDGAIRAYRKLAELSLPILRRGGRLLQASCSSRVTEVDLVATIGAAIRSQGRFARDQRTFGHALDHPITFPQGGYLKAFTATID
ncbi:MAG: class I SAM-dependent rRNA methyltransferase [Acidimicrobiales bacterium]